MTTNAILLVEDNPDDQMLTRRALSRIKVTNRVILAEDGVQALDYLFGTGEFAGRDTTDLPSVVLLDLKLPKLDGLTVLARIRADARTMLLPVVILTSSLEEKDLMQSYRSGVNSYIRKPIDFVQFVEVARHIGVYWLQLNQRPGRAHG